MDILYIRGEAYLLNVLKTLSLTIEVGRESLVWEGGVNCPLAWLGARSNVAYRRGCRSLGLVGSKFYPDYVLRRAEGAGGSGVDDQI